MDDNSAVFGQLLALLAGGQMRSCESLAQTLAVSSAQLADLLAQLESFGVVLDYADTGALLRWHEPADLLSADTVREHMHEPLRNRVAALRVDAVCDSTNDSVRQSGTPQNNNIHVALAEFQTAGRGRRGRSWESPLGSGICLSVLARYPHNQPFDSALTLAFGVALCEALSPLVNGEIMLKWPNDLMLDERKLGGILTEMLSDGEGGNLLLLGIGINVNLPDHVSFRPQAQSLLPASLCEILRARVSRAEIVARVLDGLVNLLDSYWPSGFAAVRQKWNDRDFFRHQAVRAFVADEFVSGVALGVNAEGALILEVDGERHYLSSGEVSVRRQ